jgi:hypothetical protein
LVYPGTDSDLDGYAPRKISKSFLYTRRPTLAGFISRNPRCGTGLVLVVPNTSADFAANPQTASVVLRKLDWLRTLVGADSIALAGQLPGIISRRNGLLKKPFVNGDKGTVFCVTETISSVLRRHNLSKSIVKIAVVGVGHVGGSLLTALRSDGFEAIGIDIEPRHGSFIIRDGGESVLGNADIVVVLTPRGSDFLPYLKLLKNDAIIVDDTHPKIKEADQPEGMHFYKVAVGIGNSRFYPRLPGYRPNWIPGCAIEAMTAAVTGEFNGTSQENFNKQARELGFFAHMVK